MLILNSNPAKEEFNEELEREVDQYFEREQDGED